MVAGESEEAGRRPGPCGRRGLLRFVGENRDPSLSIAYIASGMTLLGIDKCMRDSVGEKRVVEDNGLGIRLCPVSARRYQHNTPLYRYCSTRDLVIGRLTFSALARIIFLFFCALGSPPSVSAAGGGDGGGGGRGLLAAFDTFDVVFCWRVGRFAIFAERPMVVR